jgi:hypothetical protein
MDVSSIMYNITDLECFRLYHCDDSGISEKMQEENYLHLNPSINMCIYMCVCVCVTCSHLICITTCFSIREHRGIFDSWKGDK